MKIVANPPPYSFGRLSSIINPPPPERSSLSLALARHFEKDGMSPRRWNFEGTRLPSLSQMKVPAMG